MLLSNKLIYSDRLKCGSEAVASQSLSLPNDSFLRFLHTKSTCRGPSCWLDRLMDKRCVVSAVFSYLF